MARAAVLALLWATAEAVPPAPTVTLANGVKMPMLAAGTWQYNDTEAEASVSAALQVGIRLIDTAYDYNNQAGVGRALKKTSVPRSEIFLETKIPGCGLQNVSALRCYDDTKARLQDDLSLLGQDYVDLVLVHFPPVASFVLKTCSWSCTAVRDQWRALEEFYAAGKAKAIGVSNYCPSCFKCLEDDKDLKVHPMVNQVMFHIGMGPDPSGFLSFAKSKNVALQAYSPLGNSASTHGAEPEILSGNFTTSLAKAHSKSTIQVALKWLVQHGVPVVTKSGNAEHLAEDLDLWSWDLTASEFEQADQFKLAGSPSFACNSEEFKLVV